LSIKIHLHKSHRPLAEGQETVEVRGKTVGECIQDLVGRYPDLTPEIFDKEGRLKKIVEIYLNLESAYPDELARPTRDGDEIHITVLLAGG
jgi:adenylyltransferase/sulfurtransferase